MRREQDMALTLTDFFRTLPHALEGWVARPLDERTVAATGDGGRRVTIQATPLPPRRLGPTLVLPRALVALELEGFAPAEAEDFLLRFDRVFQRGGG